MAKIKGSAKRFRFKQPRLKNDEQEFRRGKKGILMCSDCGAAYYEKSWHHSLLKIKSVKKDTPVDFSLCPACKMVKNHQFEGEVTILNIPSKQRAELINFIEGFCERAYDRDPMDRLIEIKKSGDSLVVTTTENQLANKLGRKIKNLFNNVKAETKFIAAPGDVGRVRIEFSKK